MSFNFLKNKKKRDKFYHVCCTREYLTSSSYIDTFRYVLLGGERHRVRYGVRIDLLYFCRARDYEPYYLCLNIHLGARTFVHQEYQFLKPWTQHNQFRMTGYGLDGCINPFQFKRIWAKLLPYCQQWHQQIHAECLPRSEILRLQGRINRKNIYLIDFFAT